MLLALTLLLPPVVPLGLWPASREGERPSTHQSENFLCAWLAPLARKWLNKGVVSTMRIESMLTSSHAPKSASPRGDPSLVDLPLSASTDEQDCSSAAWPKATCPSISGLGCVAANAAALALPSVTFRSAAMKHSTPPDRYAQFSSTGKAIPQTSRSLMVVAFTETSPAKSSS